MRSTAPDTHRDGPRHSLNDLQRDAIAADSPSLGTESAGAERVDIEPLAGSSREARSAVTGRESDARGRLPAEGFAAALPLGVRQERLAGPDPRAGAQCHHGGPRHPRAAGERHPHFETLIGREDQIGRLDVLHQRPEGEHHRDVPITPHSQFVGADLGDLEQIATISGSGGVSEAAAGALAAQNSPTAL